MSKPYYGVYERLLDKELQGLIDSNPNAISTFRAIDEECTSHTYAQFVGQLLQKAFRIAKKDQQISILNQIIELLTSFDGLEYLKQHKLLDKEKNLLTTITEVNTSLPRPETPFSTSVLLTGQGADPALEHELRTEMATSNQIDILVSFIKWSGLRLLIPAFEHLASENIPVRIISTSYMGASDPAALEWLARQNNVSIRLSYDSNRTRLHAKAYHFKRKTGFSTAYIGSANMSHAAMTQGLEWTMKVTNQDMPHILARFEAEFSTYWENGEFEHFDDRQFSRFRKAINNYRQRSENGPQFFAEISPRPFQLRVLEALEAARQRGVKRNLVVAATGTGKTVISALDYKRLITPNQTRPNLLFVVHRKEILEQALGCFRTVLRDQNFGELLVDGMEPSEWTHVFASIQSLNSNKPWLELGKDHFNYVVVDEAHHGAASSYRPLFEHLQPSILLGLTATPERMDGSSILPDFENQFATEIRLPEALEEKLLCPFHYFGVADSIDLDGDRFWRNGRYDKSALENIFTGNDFRAKQRVDTILQALNRYLPDLTDVRAVGFCAGVKHANYMADHFNQTGIDAEVLLGDTPKEVRRDRLRAFREGKLTFLFTVDVLSEGIDVPEINLVLFLRPTESLTVFLQQLGRGLRHAKEKDCLTVLDFVGQTHKKYRLDTKFTHLLSRGRQRIDREIIKDFPNLPPGCSIQLERVAKERILEKIRWILNDLKNFIPEAIQTWQNDTDRPLNFGNFIDETGLTALEILKNKSWSEWKAIANHLPPPQDPDFIQGKKALKRIALRTAPEIIQFLKDTAKLDITQEPQSTFSKQLATAVHYLMWGQKGQKIGVSTLRESIGKWQDNPTIAEDAAEIATWKQRRLLIPLREIQLPFPCMLKLHASYGLNEIKSALDLATLEKSGPTGTGVMHCKTRKAYVHLVTFRKEEKDFSPTTLYQDYPISRKLLHWESGSRTTQESETGQNYIRFKEREYTILFFARLEKKVDGETAPFLYLGPANQLVSFEKNRPVSMIWSLKYPMPAVLYEDARSA
ncbi:MAG: DUF3427 domain-containing protein [Opitutae bacterium]|nr:DUF3427 domain-containing protein [Opitutae bacterium]